MRETLATRTVPAANPGPGPDGVFRRLLVVVDGSDAAAAARELARDWADTFGARTTFVTLEERTARRDGDGTPPFGADASVRLTAEGHTLGARNRALVGGIAAAAEAFDADLIVLGCDHRRLARHHVGPSLRERLARVTELPVVVAPGYPSPSRAHDDAEGAAVYEFGTGRYARV